MSIHWLYSFWGKNVSAAWLVEGAISVADDITIWGGTPKLTMIPRLTLSNIISSISVYITYPHHIISTLYPREATINHHLSILMPSPLWGPSISKHLQLLDQWLWPAGGPGDLQSWWWDRAVGSCATILVAVWLGLPFGEIKKGF